MTALDLARRFVPLSQRARVQARWWARNDAPRTVRGALRRHGARRGARHTVRRRASGEAWSAGAEGARAVVAPSSCRDVVVVVAIAPCETPVTTQAAAAASETHDARRTAAVAEVGE